MSVDVVDVVVVLGCRPSPMLTWRCAQAVRLLADGRARRVFVTGTAAEVVAMVDHVVAAGVDEDRVVRDDLARRTLDNLRHAKAFVGDDRCLVVTSAFHLPRVLFLSRRLRLKAEGVAARGPPAQTSTLLREAVSWVGAVVDVARL